MNFLLSKNQISLALSSWAILSSGNSDTLLFCSLKIDLISYSKLRIDHEMRDFSDEIKQKSFNIWKLWVYTGTIQQNVKGTAKLRKNTSKQNCNYSQLCSTIIVNLEARASLQTVLQSLEQKDRKLAQVGNVSNQPSVTGD